jgi:hypothetical protein
MRFVLYEYDLDCYKVRFFPPRRDAQAVPANEKWAVKVDGAATIQADLIQIDFLKQEFDRSVASVCDPSYEIIKRVLDWYILRLRHITRAACIRPIDFPMAKWRLVYLNDDESELKQEEGFVRARWGTLTAVNCIALTDTIWNSLHSLPPDYAPLPWESLLLDAAIPGTPHGNAIVLAATALEVFISNVLDRLAETRAKPDKLWECINNRPNYQSEPSVEEQYDKLLSILTGHSLKEDKKLWEAFTHLERARNSFVHQGVIRIGDVPTVVDSPAVATLISAAHQIITKVRGWLPPELLWDQHDHNVRIEVSHRILP